MNSFLVDVNLPKSFSFFNHPNFIFIAAINVQMTDNQIWNTALKNEHIILTKDADFYSKFYYQIHLQKLFFLDSEIIH